MSENGEIKGTSIDPTDSDKLSALTKELVNDPEILAKFGKKLMDFVGSPSGYLESLPKNIKKRVRALRKIQLDIFKVESKFYEEVHKLESKYNELYKPLFDKRSDIVNAVVEPTEEEANWQEDECHKEGGDCCDHEAHEGESDKPDCLDSRFDENTKGIPSFWYTTLMNIPLFDELVLNHDEDVLKQLKDIRVTYNDEKSDDLFFEIHFEFNENKYFEDKVLTKKYYLKTEPSTSYPLVYEGPEIYKSSECKINWREGMNLTSAEELNKIAKTKLTEKDYKSFFEIFASHEMDAESYKNITEDDKDLLQHIQVSDFEVGQLLQSSVIPKAVLYFTGEMTAHGEDEDDCEDEDEGEYDEDEDADYEPKGAKPECKQQ